MKVNITIEFCIFELVYFEYIIKNMKPWLKNGVCSDYSLYIFVKETITITGVGENAAARQDRK